MHRNSENYADITAGAAMSNYDKGLSMHSRRYVFISSPYAGDINSNTEKAKVYSRFAIDKGYIPITPHIYFTQLLKDSSHYERELGMRMGLRMMRLCDEVWVFGKVISPGMKREIRYAKSMNKKIRYFTEV